MASRKVSTSKSSKSKSSRKSPKKAKSRQLLSEIPRRRGKKKTTSSSKKKSSSRKNATPSTRELFSEVAKVGRKIKRQVRKAI